MNPVVRQDLDALNAVLSVSLPANDCKRIVEEKLKDFKKKAQIKGFRKGHTPEGLIRKMYGQSILSEVVFDEMNKRLQDYIREERPLFFGQPILSDEQEPLEFDINNIGDYTMRFDMGLVPDFELKGLDSSHSVTIPDVQFGDKEIDQEVEHLRRRFGDRKDLEDAVIEENDYVELHLEEWENGEKKPDGVHTHTHFLINDRMGDDLRQQMLGKKIKDKFQFDPYQAEKGATRESVRKYLLNLPEDAPETSHEFLARIDKITRVSPAELNQELFDKAFGPGIVTDEASMREQLRQQVANVYKSRVEDYLSTYMRVNLVAANKMPLPEDFLRRWMLTSESGKPEDEDWDDEKFDRFFRDLRWTLVREKIQEKFDLDVNEEDILEVYKEKLTQYFGGNPDPQLIEAIAPRVLQDKDMRGKMAEEAMQRKVFLAFRDNVNLQTKSMSVEEFRDWFETANEELERQFLAN